MGTQHQEETLDHWDEFVNASMKYQQILSEYCTLAVCDSLNDRQAERMAELLTEAEADPLLSFWFDEADHLIAHQLGLIAQESIQCQQNQLRSMIRKTWIDLLLQEIQEKTKAIQVYLKHEGTYQGAVDGQLGPSTHAALQLLQKKHNRVTERMVWNDRLQSWSVC